MQPSPTLQPGKGQRQLISHFEHDTSFWQDARTSADWPGGKPACSHIHYTVPRSVWGVSATLAIHSPVGMCPSSGSSLVLVRKRPRPSIPICTRHPATCFSALKQQECTQTTDHPLRRQQTVRCLGRCALYEGMQRLQNVSCMACFNCSSMVPTSVCHRTVKPLRHCVKMCCRAHLDDVVRHRRAAVILNVIPQFPCHVGAWPGCTVR